MTSNCKSTGGEEALRYFVQLYEVEREVPDLDPDQRRHIRQPKVSRGGASVALDCARVNAPCLNGHACASRDGVSSYVKRVVQFVLAWSHQLLIAPM